MTFESAEPTVEDQVEASYLRAMDALFDAAVQLGESDDGDAEVLGEELEPTGDGRNLLVARAHARMGRGIGLIEAVKASRTVGVRPERQVDADGSLSGPLQVPAEVARAGREVEDRRTGG